MKKEPDDEQTKKLAALCIKLQRIVERQEKRIKILENRLHDCENQLEYIARKK